MITAILAAWAATALAAPRASDQSRETGVYAMELSRGATVLDYNGDNLQDLVVGRHYRGFFHLYRNNGAGGFTDVHQIAFPLRKENRDRHGCAAADVDNNGFEDIYCTTGGKKGGTGPNPNELWMQRAPGAFVDQAREMKVTDQYGRGRRAIFFDANGDPYPDLLVGNTYPRKDQRSGANHLYINHDGERFRRAKGVGLDRVVGSNSLQVADLDGDLLDDVFLCGPKGIRLYQRVIKRYYDVTKQLNADLDCRAATLAQMNGDSRADLVRVSDYGLSVHLRQSHGFSRPVYRLPTETGRELAVGDINGDGRDDVYLLRSGRFNHDARDVMLLNRRNGHRMRKVRIPQTRLGIGEAVTSLDYDRDGSADFLVQNGHRKAKGPTRMISFR